jgi:hypothetical protein
MGDWEADEVISHEYVKGFLWIVPAQVAGDWMFVGMEGGPIRITLSQNYQNIGGIFTFASSSHPLVGAKLRGNDISFQFRTTDKNLHTFSGRISGGSISGTLNSSGFFSSVVARRM